MTVQLPILLWTVINFCLLMLILHHFLFGPMLSFMDKRQEKIDRAARKKEEYDRALAEAEAALTAFRAEEERHLAEHIQKEIADAKKNADDLITITHRKQNQNLDLHVAELELESQEIEKIMDTRLEELAKLYVSTLLS